MEFFEAFLRSNFKISERTNKIYFETVMMNYKRLSSMFEDDYLRISSLSIGPIQRDLIGEIKFTVSLLDRDGGVTAPILDYQQWRAGESRDKDKCVKVFGDYFLISFDFFEEKKRKVSGDFKINIDTSRCKFYFWLNVSGIRQQWNGISECEPHGNRLLKEEAELFKFQLASQDIPEEFIKSNCSVQKLSADLNS